MYKILFDCDNTMGLEGCDVDDGLTLLYLLGREDVELLGVTTTFGNSTIDKVHTNTINMFNELKLSHIPLYKGCPSKVNRESEACEFLVQMVNKYPNEITILATGSLTNLYGAYNLDNSFFTKVKDIVLMGGITEPLIINGYNLNELNFACDEEATHKVLSSGAKVHILTGHICLQALFTKNDLNKIVENHTLPIFNYIKKKTLPWFDHVMGKFAMDGFHNWDIVAAMYITNPELFKDNYANLVSIPEDLKKGYLKIDISDKYGYVVNMPTEITDINKFNEIIIETWKNCDKLFQ